MKSWPPYAGSQLQLVEANFTQQSTLVRALQRSKLMNPDLSPRTSGQRRYHPGAVSFQFADERIVSKKLCADNFRRTLSSTQAFLLPCEPLSNQVAPHFLITTSVHFCIHSSASLQRGYLALAEAEPSGSRLYYLQVPKKRILLPDSAIDRKRCTVEQVKSRIVRFLCGGPWILGSFTSTT